MMLYFYVGWFSFQCFCISSNDSLFIHCCIVGRGLGRVLIAVVLALFWLVLIPLFVALFVAAKAVTSGLLYLNTKLPINTFFLSSPNEIAANLPEDDKVDETR